MRIGLLALVGMLFLGSNALAGECTLVSGAVEISSTPLKGSEASAVQGRNGSDLNMLRCIISKGNKVPITGWAKKLDKVKCEEQSKKTVNDACLVAQQRIAACDPNAGDKLLGWNRIITVSIATLRASDGSTATLQFAGEKCIAVNKLQFQNLTQDKN